MTIKKTIVYTDSHDKNRLIARSNEEVELEQNEIRLTLSTGNGREFSALLLEAAGAKTGVVLMHGRNSGPDGVVVGRLRRTLNAAGYTTLSIQNPVPPSGDEFPEYVKDLKDNNHVFPEARKRIHAALAALRKRGTHSAVLLGFSMGARMQAAFLAAGESTEIPITCFVALSIGTNGIQELDSTTTLKNVRVPVLEIYGGGDADVANSAEPRKAAYASGPGKSHTQIAIAGAAHNFAGAEDDLERKVRDWLSSNAPAQR